MRRIITLGLGLIAMLALSGVAHATDGGGMAIAKLTSHGSTLVAATFAMAIAAFGCGIAQGIGLKGACEGIARNPEAGDKITVTLILGLAFIESLAIYALVINLLLFFINPLAKY